MKRLKVVLRPEAIEDLIELQDYIRDQGAPRSAAGYVRRLRARCAALGDAPYGGTARDDLEPGLRTVGFERRAVIAYRVLDDRVQITNVFYGGRDLEAIYGRREGED